ncbi:MAG TPA: 3-hydroxyacyl-CoA dehydrogenase NAD-binding domain-containing protein, partial [Burkholderiaceae bacterium]|nr:3-hydroxyacyl-CoA dehydrogenase NAD-binding domain-containing protein [Burkholderiaceae bacterium]
MGVHYELRGTVAVLQIDRPPVNSLSLAVRQGLAAGLERALDDARVQAIVITGTDRMFSGGADIQEFNTPAAAADPNLLRLIEAIEAARKPVIAAINGVCMGGGLELALACHYRVATRTASLGLPEVRVGLVPGAGGTQRLPRAIGSERALQMILSGEPVDGEMAARDGLVECVVPDTTFQGVLDFAASIAGRASHPRLREQPVPLPAGFDATPFFAAAREQVKKTARGLTAPLACIDALEGAVARRFDEGLARERSIFIARLHSAEFAARRYAFFAERAAARIPEAATVSPARPLRTAAVIGCGTMGAEIAMACAAAGLPVHVVETKADTLERGMQNCRARWADAARDGKMTAAALERCLALMRPTLTFEDIGAADIVIEAVFEDPALKEHVFARLDRVMRRGAVLATTTSSVAIDRVAAATSRPQDVIGMHFSGPLPGARLIEIVRATQTGGDVLAAVLQLARRLKRAAIVAGPGGFVSSRLLAHYRRQALRLVEDGASIAQVDAALTDFGMAAGVFAMWDVAGLDSSTPIDAQHGTADVDSPRLPERLAARGRLGGKTGKGFYGYAPASRVPIPDPDVDALIDAYRRELQIEPRKVSDDEIIERCVFALVNEGARIVEEGVAARCSDVDVV